MRLARRRTIPRRAVAVALVMVAGIFASQYAARAQSQGGTQTMPQGKTPMTGAARGRWMQPGQGWIGQESDQWMGPGMGPWMGRGASMVRHMYYMHNGVPLDYRGRFNPLDRTPEIVREGAVLYSENCASCHGAQGFGDGEAGRDLDPPPANLAHMIRMPMLNDEYLLWTISEGGAPFGSAMTAFEDKLTEEEIWKIVAAMRAGFPAPARSERPVGTGSGSEGAPAEGLLSAAEVRAQLEQWVLWYGNPNLEVGTVEEKEGDMILGEIVTLEGSVVQRIEIDRRSGWMRPVP